MSGNPSFEKILHQWIEKVKKFQNGGSCDTPIGK
jgi:hypothetical protein